MGDRVDAPADRVTRRDLEQFLQTRLGERTASTVHKERDTIGSMFKWAVAKGYLEASPAVGLPPIKEEVELPPFQTVAEIDAILVRGGLGDEEATKLWDCLYLTTAEIAGLLQTV